MKAGNTALRKAFRCFVYQEDATTFGTIVQDCSVVFCKVLNPLLIESMWGDLTEDFIYG